jgi:cysteine-rich repeat protein
MAYRPSFSIVAVLSCLFILAAAQDTSSVTVSTPSGTPSTRVVTRTASSSPTSVPSDLPYNDIPKNLTVLDIYDTPGSFRFNGSTCNVTQTPSVKRVAYFVSNGYAVIDGDVIYGTEAQLLASAVTPNVPIRRDLHARSFSLTPMSSSKWAGGKVYYYFNAALPAAQQQGFLDAAKVWTDRLPFLQFINDKTNPTAREIVGIPGSASFSPLGCCGGQLQMGLATSSSWIVGITVHEIGHTLGLIHEHKRPDRDYYINIDFTNIQAGMSYNFDKEPPNSWNWAGPYDIDSVMHYNDGTFSADSSKPVITGANGIFFRPCCRMLPTLQDLRHVCELYWENCHSICGDGVLSPQFEQCDDGNNINGDGCSSDCKGATCGPTSVTCTPGAVVGPHACGLRATCQDFDAFGNPPNFGKDFCVCQAGYRATGVDPLDTSEQFRMTWINSYGSQTHRVFVRPGQDCTQLCDEGLGDPRDCSEVPIKDSCR